MYQFEDENRLFAVYMSYVGAPGCGADILHSEWIKDAIANVAISLVIFLIDLGYSPSVF